MNYREAMEYMEQATNYGIVPGLDNCKELLRRLGDPQKKLNVIHLAGTNGKGSTLAFLTAILSAQGYRIGSYVSPAVFCYQEHFLLQGKPISKIQTARLVERVAKEADKMAREGMSHPTAFEMETAMAFVLFVEKGCELVILETGMGGEMDATNVIEEPLICVITPISMDHQAFLGDSLEKIARQKAGIMKGSAVVISAPQPEAAAKVLIDFAQQRQVSSFTFVPQQREKVKQNRSLNGQKFTYGDYQQLKISMLGKYQVDNAALVCEVIQRLQNLGYPVTEAALRKGLAEAAWPGRFQLISRKPIFIVDGAHNEAGAIALKKSLEFYFTNKRIIYIMGMFRDKDGERILTHLAHLAEQVITVHAKGNKRALSSLELAQIAARFHPCVTAAASVEEGVELAYLLSDEETVIVAFGSLAYLGDCIQAVKNRKQKMGTK